MSNTTTSFPKSLSQFTKITLLIGVLLVGYGIVCRLLNLYLFWESTVIGSTIILVGALSFFLDRIRIKRAHSKNTTGEKFAVGGISFILLMQAILYTTFFTTDAYRVAKNYVEHDENLANDLGKINNSVLLPFGNIITTIDATGTYGDASFTFIVKGSKKFRELTVFVNKNVEDSEWKIVDVR